MLKISTQKDNKIIGLWKITGDDSKSSNFYLKNLCYIPYECKCTYSNIHLYAFTLGQYIATLHFWMNYKEWKDSIAFLPWNVYQVW